jgi:hypothetical protein
MQNHSNAMPMQFSELVIKVPAPFLGVDSVGFTARYREGETLGDIPLLIEGEADILARLQPRLELLGEPQGEPYLWTTPVSLSDELVIMAWRDRSQRPGLLTSSGEAARAAIQNLVRPVAFAFLRDCARYGRLRLADVILMTMRSAGGSAELELRRQEIVAENGDFLLFPLND